MSISLFKEAVKGSFEAAWNRPPWSCLAMVQPCLIRGLAIDIMIERLYYNLNNEMEVHRQMGRNELLDYLNRMMQVYDVERLRCIYYFALHLGKGIVCDE